MKISEKANDLIGEFSSAVERTALSPSESMFRLYCATRENLEDYIAELEGFTDKLAAALTHTYNKLPTHWRGADWCPYDYHALMVELKRLKEG